VLIVLPYGMCFRNIVMNATLWEYLTSAFHVDVMTDFAISDVASLGIRRVLPLTPRGSLARAAAAVNYATAHCLRLLNETKFFMTADLGSTWAGIYRHLLRTEGKRGRLLLFGAIREFRRYWPASWIVGLINAFPRACPALRPLRRDAYALVILGHTNENWCILAGRKANRLGIPVVGAVMGADNLLHGLLEFVPDLLLCWGEEQARELRDYHVPLAPALARTRCEVVGTLVYDNYVATAAAPDPEAGSFAAQYRIEPGDDVVLFAAYPTSLLAGQQILGETLVECLRQCRPGAKVIVRLRPGMDPAEWRDFVDRHADVVRLQVPYGAAYDKGDTLSSFDPEEAQRDIALFVRTMLASRLVVLPSLSTMYLDALVFGVPSLIAMYNFEAPDSLIPHRDLKAYVDYTMIDPVFTMLPVATSRRAFAEALTRFFATGDSDGFRAERVFAFQTASSRDGGVGARARQAIERLAAARVPAAAPAP
jgi:hypothetical protein